MGRRCCKGQRATPIPGGGPVTSGPNSPNGSTTISKVSLLDLHYIMPFEIFYYNQYSIWSSNDYFFLFEEHFHIFHVRSVKSFHENIRNEISIVLFMLDSPLQVIIKRCNFFGFLNSIFMRKHSHVIWLLEHRIFWNDN